MNDELLYCVADGIAVITINRPQRRNALSNAVRTGFFEAWQRFESDPAAQEGPRAFREKRKPVWKGC